MVSNLNTYYSHPDKLLLTHIEGVSNNTRLLSCSKLPELLAIFHDLGKINPNFQAKLFPARSTGYSNHSYLSAFTFFCSFASSMHNREQLKSFLELTDGLTDNDIIAITVLLAKHHGNIPNFQPKDNGSGVTILSKTENEKMFCLLDDVELPIMDYVNHFIEVENFSHILSDKKFRHGYMNYLVFRDNPVEKALDFFLDYQFAFSCLIQSDKADAAKFDNFITQQRNSISEFSKVYVNKLDVYLSKLDDSKELNRLRTHIRKDAITNLNQKLIDKRVFELTAPTGSGKTLMLLSLASEIMKKKGAKRVIYILPFLSITEQVENEVLKIFKGYEQYIQRVDSKSENKRFEFLQNSLDTEANKDILEELDLLEFQENTFAYPFVITTFVRFFEALLSNRNSELLKLPNFSNCIFLLDEIQSLPPRLYGFFIGYLTRFCEKFNSYAIVSTATQPNFELPNDTEIKSFLSRYHVPTPLLPIAYFEEELFNRYHITYHHDNMDLKTLKDYILAEEQSVLVILNTIDDSKDLFRLLSEDLPNEALLLLNTHFTPLDRKIKIYLAKRRLKEGKRIIVVSTQLIEAGVDIDFPVLYRDFCTIPSIVQSAGRCNRNGNLIDKGKVHLFHLFKDNRSRANLIYRGKDKDLLRFTREAFSASSYQESELLSVQKDFFNKIQQQFHFGKHWIQGNEDLRQPDFDFVKDIKQCMYDKIGKFHLIDKSVFGEECKYYVAKNERDANFETLIEKQLELIDLLKSNVDFSSLKMKKREIELHLKRMSNRIVQIRLKKNQHKPLLASEEHYFDLYKIDSGCYSFVKGVDLEGEESLL